MMKRPVDTFAPEALDLLESYPFPGNVRELANAIERGVALATGVRVEARDLPAALTEPARDSPAGTFPTLEAVEWRHIRQALDAAGGNQTQAAQMLGIDRVSLWRKLKRHEAKGGA